MSRIHVPISLRWSDLDAYGHVNNAEMLRLLEEARIRVFWADGDAPPQAHAEDGSPLPTAVISGGPGAETATLIAGQQIEYLAPVPFLRRPLDVQLWIGSLGGASIEICYEVWSPEGVEPATLFAKAATTLVLVDAATERPRRLSEGERAAWAPYVEAPVQFRGR